MHHTADYEAPRPAAAVAGAMRCAARPRSEQSLARVVVNDLPHSRRAFKDQSEPAGRVAAARRGTLQHELTGCQGDPIRERTNLNFREDQSTHGLVCRT